MGKVLYDYFAEIAKADLLSDEEEQKLIKAVQEKGTSCNEMKQLKKCSARFVISLSSQYKVHGIDRMRQIEAGNIGLREAAVEMYNRNESAESQFSFQYESFY